MIAETNNKIVDVYDQDFSDFDQTPQTYHLKIQMENSNTPL
jgi:hypothetical protein